VPGGGGEVETPIVPVVVGGAEAAVAASDRALADGVFAQAIRPPTVPDGSSRLRLAVMATHTKSELRDAARTIAAAVRARELAATSPFAGTGVSVFDGLADAA
jgi:glycine C-acetyltransferase/8-amino-7-oxononanoate synthase